MPTSPVEPSRAPSPAASTQPRSIRAEWRRIGAFLRRPSLDSHAHEDAPLGVILRVYALDMAVMIALISIAGAVVALGVDLPKTALAQTEFTLPVVLLVIIAAPVLEELIFRGWLSGKPGHVFALIALFAGTGAFAAIGADQPLVRGLVLIIALFIAVAALVVLRRLPAMGWFARGFPLFFWLSAIVFALIHLANFSEGSLAVLLPLVLPQFVLGTLLGYLRVKIGLWAAMLLHAMHNATALGIASLAMESGDKAAG